MFILKSEHLNAKSRTKTSLGKIIFLFMQISFGGLLFQQMLCGKEKAQLQLKLSNAGE